MTADSLEIFFIGSFSGIYIITGYFLNKFRKRISNILLYTFFMISLFINILCISYLRISGYKYVNSIWYTNFFTYLTIIGLLLIVKIR